MCALLAQPAAAYQFGGLLGGGRSSSSSSDDNCDTGNENRSRSVIGSVLGGAARMVGVPTFVPSSTFADVLATAIACRLDEEEQEKAADATVEATRSGAVGSTAEWESETRPGVRGSSTVTGRTQRASAECLEVTDVVIVDGEELRQPKTMCRTPPSTRYALAA
jgi:surface antigen